MFDRDRTQLTRRSFITGLAATAGYCGPTWAADLKLPVEPPAVPAGQLHLNSYAERSARKILYATDRKQTRSRQFDNQFGTERARQLSYGLVGVRLANRNEDAIITSVHSLDRDEYLNQVEARAAESGGGAILFVHGFNTSWTDEMLAVAKLSADIRARRPMLAFSWTSRDSFSIRGYAGDQEEVEWSADDLKEVLLTLLQADDIGNVQIIAHSLGARGVLAALKAIYYSSSSFAIEKLRHVVFCLARRRRGHHGSGLPALIAHLQDGHDHLCQRQGLGHEPIPVDTR